MKTFKDLSSVAKKEIKETPKTCPLSLPIATERTIKKSKEVIKGDSSV